MTTEVNVNQNYAECIKSISHWGSTEYVNICQHATSIVEWGSVDYALACVGFAILGTFALMILGFVVAMITDLW